MKVEVPPNDSLHSRRRSRFIVHRKYTVVTCITLVAFARWYCTTIPTLGCIGVQKVLTDKSNGEGLTEPWDWITPSEDLVFHDCFDHHQCARLSVPMDWNDTDLNGSRVNLAITKLPARVPITDPRYGGLLWLQIGGPGSSGVDFLLIHGKTVQMIVDSPLDPNDDYDKVNPPKYFDVLGFDPRGVNNTTPRLMCFPDATSRDIWTLQSNAEGVLGSSENSFTNLWARSTALSEGCSRRFAESENPEDKLAFHMNTSPVVADIVEVIEKYGKWREEEAERWVLGKGVTTYEKDESSRIWHHPDEDSRADWEALQRTHWKRGEEKIFYWGLSYGTILGATFAAMQPHRIERAILDSVADTPDYYRGEWLTNLQDTDILLDKFGEYCYKAGPHNCALYAEGGAQTIKQKFKDTVESLKDNPIGVPARGSLAPDLITYSDLKQAIGQAVYAPIQFFPSLATYISDLSNRNGTSFAIAKQAGRPIQLLPSHCRSATPYAPECAGPANLQGETSTAILCTDGNGSFGMTKEAYSEYAAHLREQSWLLGETWARIRLGCVGWGIRPKWRFPGPFGGETAKPMLIVGNLHDPVTPIRNAYAMAERFPGSAVLGLEAEGHCIMASPSLCMARHLRAYYQTGAFPDHGTICDDNEKPFIGLTKRGEAEEEELLEQLRWTASHFLS